MYRERRASIAGAVVWESVLAQPEVGILPDGCMDLIWHDGDLLIAGPDTAVHPFIAAVGTSMIGLRLPPGMAPTLLGVPAHAVRNERVALDAVWPAAEVRRLIDEIGGGGDDGAAVMERCAVAGLIRSGPVTPVVGEIVAMAEANASVAAIADRVGLGERQLHRRCLDAFGYGAKTLTRIMRMRRALTLADAGVPLARTAAEVGYADQAHLARDVRALTGSTLTALLG